MSKRFGSWFNFSRTCLGALLVVTFAWSSEFLALNFLLCISIYLPPKKAKAGTMWEGLGKSRRYKHCLHSPYCNIISWDACFLPSCLQGTTALLFPRSHLPEDFICILKLYTTAQTYKHQSLHTCLILLQHAIRCQKHASQLPQSCFTSVVCTLHSHVTPSWDLECTSLQEWPKPSQNCVIKRFRV